MILPSGKRRDQIAQGGSKYTSIFDSDIFKNVKISQESLEDAPEQPRSTSSKDLKMDELQQTMNESNTLPQGKPQEEPLQQTPTEKPEANPIDGAGSEFIDISKRISEKVIDALGLNSRPGEHWAGKTEIANDGDEVTGITIKLTRAQPKDMMMQPKVEKSGPGYGEPLKQPQQPQGVSPGGPVTNSV